jgi:hypothetical protein
VSYAVGDFFIFKQSDEYVENECVLESEEETRVGGDGCLRVRWTVGMLLLLEKEWGDI